MRSKIQKMSVLFAIVSVLMGSGIAYVHAQDGGTLFLPIISSGETSPTANQSSKISASVYEALINDGEVNIFIMLHSPEDQGVQAAGISALKAQTASLQNQVLSTMSPNAFKSTKLFSLTTGIVGRVYSEEALKSLENNPTVRKVDISGGGGTGGLRDSIGIVGGDVSYETGLTGRDVVVAVMDTGFDSDHPAIAHSLRGEACFERCSGPQSGPGTAEDDHGHGTFVTAIISSKGGDGVARGMAPEAGIVAIKSLDSNNSFQSTNELVEAWDFIYENHPEVKIINMSLGTSERFSDNPCDDTYSWTQGMQQSAKRLRDRGTLLVVISGNNSESDKIQNPGCLSAVYTVGATDKDDTYASYSNSNEKVDVVAPGTDMTSAKYGGGTQSGWQGTSFAAPHVAGCAALLVQTGMTDVDELERRLSESPVRVTNPANGLAYPRLDCALTDVVVPTPGPPTLTPTPTPIPEVSEVLNVSGNLGCNGCTREYSFTAPPGAQRIRVNLTADRGPVEVYGKYGSAPTTSDYDFRGARAVYNDPQAGRWYVLVQNTGGFVTDYNLVITTENDTDAQPTPTPGPPTSTPTPAPTPTPADPATALRIRMNQIQVDAGASASVPVQIIAGPSGESIGAVSATINYDDSVVSVTDCTLADFQGSCSISVSGEVRISGISSDGVSGDSTLANIDIQAIGAADESSPMDMTIQAVANVAGTSITNYIVEDGSVTIGGSAPMTLGDVNCDNTTNVTDALFVMQYEVGLRTDSGSCPLGDSETQLHAAAADVSGDGNVTVLDALFIMQCDVGIENSFCSGADRVFAGSAAQLPGPATISMAQSDATVTVSTDANNLAAGSFIVHYNAASASLKSCAVSTTGFCNEVSPGVIHFNFVNQSDSVNNVTVQLTFDSENVEVTGLNVANLVDSMSRQISYDIVDGSK